MIIAYICHPVSGRIESNLHEIREIIRNININEPNVIPFCPWYADVKSLNDDVTLERNRGMQNNEFLLRKGFIDEIRIYGNRISSGVEAEIKIAVEMGIKIVNKSTIIKDSEIIKYANSK